MKVVEQPGVGRAKITESQQDIYIVIPVKRSVYLLIGPAMFFVALWVMWSQPGMMNIIEIVRDNLFLLLPLSIGLLTGLFNLARMMFGKEKIKASVDRLTLKRPMSLLGRSKTYDLQEARLFRTEDYRNTDGTEMERFAQSFVNFNNHGIICFEYGADTIRFGLDISEAERNYILQRIKSAGFLSECHFA